MSWIEEIDAEAARGQLGEIYADLIAKRGKVSNIMQVQSLNPGAMQKHLELYMQLLYGRSGLSRADREAIAVVVSATNNCEYCVSHHAQALARYENNPDNINDLIKDLKFKNQSDRSAALLNYAAKLTQKPEKITEADINQLRAAGLSDSDILDANMITAYFNFVNRIALGLGVSFSADEVEGYKV